MEKINILKVFALDYIFFLFVLSFFFFFNVRSYYNYIIFASLACSTCDKSHFGLMSVLVQPRCVCKFQFRCLRIRIIMQKSRGRREIKGRNREQHQKGNLVNTDPLLFIFRVLTQSTPKEEWRGNRLH